MDFDTLNTNYDNRVLEALSLIERENSGDDAEWDRNIAIAQVHATLANAAAVLLAGAEISTTSRR